MKTLVVLAASVALSAAPALAADGKVSHSSLAKMGLPGMQPMSDAKGLEIRGQAVITGGGRHFAPPDPALLSARKKGGETFFSFVHHFPLNPQPLPPGTVLAK